MTDILPAKAAYVSHPAEPLHGRFATPGDKSISHRALLLGALAVGCTTIRGLLESEDVLATVAALRQLGVRIDMLGDECRVYGLGIRGLLAPEAPIDLGNSGTGLRLLMGLLSPLAFSTELTGAPTLSRRPLRALHEALGKLDPRFGLMADASLPLTWQGSSHPVPFVHTMAKPSDQIKSALLLAAAQTPGTSTIVEPIITRDHTEKMLAQFGARITITADEQGGQAIAITGLAPLQPCDIAIAGDPSSAAYAIVAALVVPGSELVVENVLINPTRTGLIDTLLEMGADIQFSNQREAGGEHVADLRVRSSRMKGLRIDAAHAAAMLDDIPALAMAAAFANGETTIHGLSELRDQECDRLAAIAAGLSANNIEVTESGDTLTIRGTGQVDGGGMIDTRGDHRIAMSFLVLGMGSRRGVSIDDASVIAASFPDFIASLTDLGAQMRPVKGQEA